MSNVTCRLVFMSEPPAGMLWQMADIAAATGLRVGSVRWHKWKGHLPAPDQHLGRSPGWKRSTIIAWVEAHRR